MNITREQLSFLIGELVSVHNEYEGYAVNYGEELARIEAEDNENVIGSLYHSALKNDLDNALAKVNYANELLAKLTATMPTA